MTQPIPEQGSKQLEEILDLVPVFVFDCLVMPTNDIRFSFASWGSLNLVGLAPEDLLANVRILPELILPDDQESFYGGLRDAAKRNLLFNWEGRIWISHTQDIKLVNVRAKALLAADGVVRLVGAMANVTQNRLDKLRIQQSQKQLSELSAHLTQVREEERLKIAREVHDDLGGNLTAIKIGLGSLINHLDASQSGLAERAKRLEFIVDNTFEAAHRIASDLRPDVLELGVVAALDWLAQEFQKQSGVQCMFRHNEEIISLGDESSITLYRICQEAMSNITKYAKATLVELELSYEKERVRFSISDNGIGFLQKDKGKKNAFGLRGMAERVSALSGDFTIESKPKWGTVISVSLPLKHVIENTDELTSYNIF